MSDEDLEMIEQLANNIEEECYHDNARAGFAAVSAIAQFYTDPHKELVMKKLRELLTSCATCDPVREAIYITIEYLKKKDNIRAQYSNK